MLVRAAGQVLNTKAMDDVAAAYKGIAKLVKPEPPYHVALDVDMKLMSRLSQPQQQQWATLLASVRMLVVGHPLRYAEMDAGRLHACMHAASSGLVLGLLPGVTTPVLMRPCCYHF